VARGQLQKVSTPEHDFIRYGFFARSPKEEMKCPDLELRVLISTENVTDRVAKKSRTPAGCDGVTDAEAGR